jgi:hypothetical protein
MIVAYVTDYKTGQVAGTTLYLLGVWDIFETTTGEVVNDEGGELWTRYLAFDIPIRYNDDMHQDIVHTGR